MKRREFITLVGAAAVWPLPLSAQQSEGMRHIAVLMGLPEDDPETKARAAKLRQELERLGWSEGHNVRIDTRFAPAGAQAQVLAKELVSLRPDVLLAHSPRSPAHCNARLARSRSYSLTCPTRLARASSKASRGRAAISPVCCTTKQASSASGWPCSRRSRRTSGALRWWPTPRAPSMTTFYAPQTLRRPRSRSSLYLPPLRTLPTSSAFSTPSRPCPMAVCSCRRISRR